MWISSATQEQSGQAIIDEWQKYAVRACVWNTHELAKNSQLFHVKISIQEFECIDCQGRQINQLYYAISVLFFSYCSSFVSNRFIVSPHASSYANKRAQVYV